MTLVLSELVLKHRVGVSGTENNTPTLCFNSHITEEIWWLSSFDRSNRKVKCSLCALGQTHTHVFVIREVQKRSSWIGYQICPFSSSVRLQPVTLDHHIFISDV